MSRLFCLALIAGAGLLTGQVIPARAQTGTPPPTDTPADPQPAPASRKTRARREGGDVLYKSGRLGVQVGGFGATGGRDAIRDRRTWGVVGLTYRLQSAGKRAFLQPDLYLDVARNYLGSDFTFGIADAALNGNNNTPTDQTAVYDMQVGTGRGFIGMGLSTRSVAYLGRGQVAVFVGAGGGLYRLEDFRRYDALDADRNRISTHDQTTYYTFRPGGKLFAGLTTRTGLYAEAALHDMGVVNQKPFRGLSIALGYRH